MAGRQWSSFSTFVGVTFCIAMTDGVRAETLYVPSKSLPTIQSAIDAAGQSGDEIVVAPGTYNETIDFLGKAIHLRSSDGANVTIIDGTGLYGSLVNCINDEGRDTILQGFTITNGFGTLTPFPFVLGGGMMIQGASPTVRSCIFRDNHVGKPFDAGSTGGAIMLDGSGALIDRCQFLRNSAPGGSGGAIAIWGGEVTITQTIFRDNIAHDGAAISLFEGNLVVLNSVFSNNTVLSLSGRGAAFNCIRSTLQVTNSTFVRNTADNGGAVISTQLFEGDYSVRGSVLWQNTAEIASDENQQIYGDVTVEYSLVSAADPFAAAIGNITGDPMFVDADGDDFRLRPRSPCIDAGNNTMFLSVATELGVATDLAGFSRFIDKLTTPDTGVGLGAIIDIGALEFGNTPGDLNHDGDIDLLDAAIMFSAFTGP
jgi:Right handed beta helix region